MTAKPASEAQEPAPHTQPNSLRPEKRPPRGMEDVVHLFLSQPPGGATVLPDTGDTPSGREPAVPPPPTVTMAYPATAPGKEEIIQLLNADTAVLETGLRAIDRGIPYDPVRTIDLLAIDCLNRLVVILLETAANDGMLLWAISQHDWVIGNVPMLRKLYQGQAINYSFSPRIFLVAPKFSPQLICAARRIQSPRIGCYRYRAIAVSSGTALFFEGA
jgi:hypothetical protein